MHPHPAEVIPKPRLKKRPRRRVERLTRLAQRLMHDRRRLGAGEVSAAIRLHLQVFLFLLLAGRAFAADLRRRGGEVQRRVRHADHLIGLAVGLALERTVDGADRELRSHANRRTGERAEQGTGTGERPDETGVLRSVPLAKAARRQEIPHRTRARRRPGTA
jgi:hypothetical protein